NPPGGVNLAIRTIAMDSAIGRSGSERPAGRECPDSARGSRVPIGVAFSAAFRNAELWVGRVNGLGRILHEPVQPLPRPDQAVALACDPLDRGRIVLQRVHARLEPDDLGARFLESYLLLGEVALQALE